MAVRAPRKKRQTSPWVFVPLATAFVIIAGIAIYGAISPYDLKTAPPPGQRGSLVWGDGIFSNRAQLKAWLGLHGASYAQWAKTHPKALFLVKPRPKRTAAQLAKARKAAALKARLAAAKKPKPAGEGGRERACRDEPAPEHRGLDRRRAGSDSRGGGRRAEPAALAGRRSRRVT